MKRADVEIIALLTQIAASGGGGGGGGSGDMLRANNLSDVLSAATSRTNLGLGTGNSPQFTAVEIGNASDSTLSRSSAGVLAVEGNIIAMKDTDNAFSVGQDILVTDSRNTGVSDPLFLAHNYSGTPTAGAGTGIVFRIQDSSTTNVNAAELAVAWSNVTHATRASYFDINLSTGGATPGLVARFTGAGGLNLGGGTTDPGAGTIRCTGIELGHDTDTTLTRLSAGKVGVEGAQLLTQAGGVKSYATKFYNNGSALSTGNSGLPVTIPYAGTITGWAISVDAGTATVKVWKKATGTAIPTVSDNINTSGVAISTGTHVRSTTVSDFTTTAVAVGDMIMVNLTAVATATALVFELEITPS